MLAREQLAEAERLLRLLDDLRATAKTDGGRLNPFGKALIAAAKANGVKQSFIAHLLDISTAAVSIQYAKLPD